MSEKPFITPRSSGYYVSIDRGQWVKEGDREVRRFPSGGITYNGSLTKEQHDGLDKVIRDYLDGCHTPSEKECEIATLTAQLAEARERLAAFEEPIRRRERLNAIVAFLFPNYDARKAYRPLMYPCCYWWNGAGIDENDVDLGSAGYSASCKVSSYVGGGEYDSMKLEIPAAWMDADDFKPLVTKWINDENDRLAREKLLREKSRAEADLRDAQRRLNAANGKV